MAVRCPLCAAQLSAESWHTSAINRNQACVDSVFAFSEGAYCLLSLRWRQRLKLWYSHIIVYSQIPRVIVSFSSESTRLSLRTSGCAPKSRRSRRMDS